MAEKSASNPSKPKSPAGLSSEPQKNINPTKSDSSKFLYKAALITVFLVLLPLFPSIAPQFINQTLHARSWELLQLILVGIAVSYGLFSQKNDELTEKDNTNTNTTTNNNNAHSIVSKLLQVSSVFDDDESESHTTIEENIKVNSQQHYREQPVVVIARPNQSPVLGKGGACEFTQKPLLLPVRSLKQTRHHEVGGSGDVVVLPSPIPWRSRSGEPSSGNSSDPPRVLESDQAKSGEDDDDDVAPPPPLPPRKQAVLSKSNSAFAVSVSPEKVFRRSVTSVQKEESLFEKVLMMESDDEDEDEIIDNNNVDVGRDVDKKADEFIAKFREQIRQQRIESIRKSTAQRAGKMSTGQL